MWVPWVVVGVAALTAIGAWRAARAARRNERHWRRYRHLAEHLPGAVLVFDRRLRHVLAAGRGLETLGGGVPVCGRTLAELFDEVTRQILEPAYRAALEGSESQVELPVNDRDWVVTVSPAGWDAGVLVAADVTDRKRRERRLTELATRDSLTGLWNRRRLDEELDRLAQVGSAGSLLVLDLDRFKLVNDTLGHGAGDRLLRSVAVAIQGCVRRSDLVARIGGDEFAVLLPGATTEEATRVAATIEAAVGAVWPLGVAGGVSIGISTAGACAGDAQGRADRAMYAAKRSRAA
jgi:diguanylate cyclase (GGDEF)-like protein